MPLHNKKNNRIYWLISGIAGFILFFAVIAFTFSVKEVTVEGNMRYSEEEIKELILGKGYANTIWVTAKSKWNGYDQIPFVSMVEVKPVSAQHIKIKIYEKMIIGYVSYMGTNVYFDKDGIMVESSSEVFEGVPKITGLNFSEVTLYEKLPVKDSDIFRIILNLNQSLQKHEIIPDRIHITEKKEIQLYFGEAKVLFGTENLMDEKIANLSSIVEDLRQRKGTLHMENFSEDAGDLIFEGD